MIAQGPAKHSVLRIFKVFFIFIVYLYPLSYLYLYPLSFIFISIIYLYIYLYLLSLSSSIVYLLQDRREYDDAHEKDYPIPFVKTYHSLQVVYC